MSSRIDMCLSWTTLALMMKWLRQPRESLVLSSCCSPYSPYFNLIEDMFSVGRSWLKRWSSPYQFNAWPMLTINSMLEHVTEERCRGFVRAAVRRYNAYVPLDNECMERASTSPAPLALPKHEHQTPPPPPPQKPRPCRRRRRRRRPPAHVAAAAAPPRKAPMASGAAAALG